MLGFLLVNLFFLAVILIGAALTFAGASVFKWLDPGPGLFAIWCAVVVSAIVLFLLYYLTKALHGFVERLANRRPSKTR